MRYKKRVMQTEQETLYDIAVIGGGPAGATVATLLAQRGRKVALFEKATHPRFHIGESLLPKNIPILERLGVLDAVKAIGIHKPGAEFVSPDHDARQCFLFSDALDPNPPHSYQVRRSQFDAILLDNARRKGVAVREGCAVSAIAFDDDTHRLTHEAQDGATECQARFVIDASGRDGLMARHMEVRQRNKSHNSAAMFAHFKAVPSEAWETPGNIAIYWFEHGWIWLIPLNDGLTSVGAVCMPDYLKSREGPLDEFFFQTLRLCPKVWDHLKDAEAATPIRAAGNYSYSATSAYGERYLLLGDAYAFIDPVFSSGVFLAMSSAELAADAIDKSLDRPRRATRFLRTYQRRIDHGITRYSWFIYRFNTPAMRTLFMEPRNVLGVRAAVVSLLAGDIYRRGGLSWRLGFFRLLFGASTLVALKRSRKWEDRRRRFRSITMADDEVAEKS
jgi:flavin-dependent dehydrogenase